MQKLLDDKNNCQICGKSHSAKECWHYLGATNQGNMQREQQFFNPNPNFAGRYSNFWEEMQIFLTFQALIVMFLDRIGGMSTTISRDSNVSTGPTIVVLEIIQTCRGF